DLGKSFLANKVVQLLNEQNIESSHLTLDSFLLDRADRKKKGISGYDVRAHHIIKIQSTLETWKNGQAIEFQPYDHHTGSKSENYRIITSSKLLLIEGLFSMHELVQPLIDLSFFFYTTDELLKEIKLEADLVKRKYTTKYSRKIYDKEFRIYKRNIKPFIEKADFMIFLKEKWKYDLKKTYT
ncbi:MAG: hypothetical protein AAFO07_27425, partial [Bacteroidota bacterium]